MLDNLQVLRAYVEFALLTLGEYVMQRRIGYNENGYTYMVRGPVKDPCISHAYVKWFSNVTPAEMMGQLRREKILR